LQFSNFFPTFANAMKQTIAKYITKEKLLAKGATVVVGFSGGADSTVLLYVLHQLGFRCIAAHCNFHLRGKESARDAEFAAEFAASLAVPYYIKDFDTKKFAENEKISIEMAARELRYKWFEEIRQAENSDAIATGHHSDDNVETVLLNLIRGTGIRGLTGIPPHNGFIIRPLLCVSRNEILHYAEKENLRFVTDSTNLQDEFTRNKIRLNLLPTLETLNPAAKENILATIGNLNEVFKIYESEIKKNRETVFNREQGKINIPLLKQFPSPESLLFEILKDYGFGREVIAEICDAIDSQSGKMFYSPSARLFKDRDNFILTCLEKSDDEEFLITEDCTEIHNPFQMTISCEPNDKNLRIDKTASCATLDFDKLRFPLVLRKWKAGDRFVPFGMTGFQKISDFFNNRKISLPEKEKTWVLLSGKNIVWIVNQRIDNRFKIEKTTKKAVIMKLF
jgi:tRNA(Ile)-lysidine synthase